MSRDFGNSPYRGPRARPAQPAPRQGPSVSTRPRPPAPTQHDRAHGEPRSSTPAAAAARPRDEVRLHGFNACMAAFAKRPEALRKVYLTEARIPALKPVLAWCVRHRLGYRVVGDDDLQRLTASQHHEGVCFDLAASEPSTWTDFLHGLPPAPAVSLLLWLDGVGNPHNLGAILRTAAHFGAHGVIAPGAARDLPAAAVRTAEGAAEHVAVVVPDDSAMALRGLRAMGYRVAATVPRDGTPLYRADLPPRLVLVLGAEDVGMSANLIADADLRLTIPGSGAIESLNVAASAAVLSGEFWRQRDPSLSR